MATELQLAFANYEDMVARHACGDRSAAAVSKARERIESLITWRPAAGVTLHVGDSKFESWFASKDMKHLGTKQLARDAYAAGMSDSAVMPAAPSDAWMRERADELVQKIHARIGTWGEQRKAIADFALEVAALSQTMQPQADRAPSMDRFEHVIRWVRDNYQDHSIASLCDGLRAAYYALCRPAEPAAGEQARAVAIINGEPAAAHSLLAALIDIYDDAQSAPPESRCYVESAWPDVLKEARAFLAAPGAAIAAREQSPDDSLLVARITLNGATLSVEPHQMAEMFGTDDEQHTYELTFKRMTRAAYEALGEFNGF